jgi:hypothetical protein
MAGRVAWWLMWALLGAFVLAVLAGAKAIPMGLAFFTVGVSYLLGLAVGKDGVS